MTAQAKILFVDDEARVLTAMRAMFRRDYEVHLANSGAEALEVLREHDIDVVVSDQRMPEMTGVEMLKEARSLAPRTMRVLLTGYADLAAIEHAINESEVFRYLMKPCPREQLREVVGLAVEASHSDDLPSVAPAQAGPAAAASTPAPQASPVAPTDNSEQADVGFLVLSRDDQLAAGVRDAVGKDQTVHTAQTLEEAVDLLQGQPVGVVVTDLAVNEQAITTLTSELKRQVPELVTIVASDRSDAHLMIELINRSQVFRFLLKPLSVGQSRIWLSSAVSRHRELLNSPDAARRFQVEAEPADAAGSAAAEERDDTESRRLLGRVLGGIRGLRSRLGT
jgi:serine/threonine-protein kinase